MRQILLFLLLSFSSTAVLQAQVTQLAANNSLEMETALSNNKIILVEQGFNRLWVSDGTPAGTFRLSDTLTYTTGDAGGVLNGKFIFSATSPNLGSELWITDGTVAGTQLVKDIIPGKTGSEPNDDFVPLNGYLYFSAISEGFGRELWRTNGTAAGTTMVTDIVSGLAGSAAKGWYDMASTGSYILFQATTTGVGYELWRSDGTEAGTFLLKDINEGPAASMPSAYQVAGNTVLFWAERAAEGRELWRTDGTTAGTQLVKDIRTGPQSSINAPGPLPAASLLFPYNNRFLFMADDGVHGTEIWTTDGTTAGTFLLKDISSDNTVSFVYLYNSVPMNGKLYFAAYQPETGSELWETDGTTAGTKIFKEIMPGADGGNPLLMPNYKIDWNATVWNPQHQGTVFYFLFGLPADAGIELWKSDGTSGGTVKVKTLRNVDSDITNFSYVYTPSGIYFSSDDGVLGDELWRSNGTDAGTIPILDLNPGPPGSDISFLPFAVNGRYLFTGSNGDAVQWDLYRLDGEMAPLPVKLEDFAVSLTGADALLKWQTASEEGTAEFVIERSDDGSRFFRIGSVIATGTSAEKRAYSFTDARITNSGKGVVYYRLLIKDKNGKEAYSKVIPVHLRNSAPSVQLMGNPVQSEIRLLVGRTTEPVSLAIRDAAGRTVKTLQVKNENGLITVPATGLTPGTYFLQAVCGGKSSMVKFLKQ